MATIVITVDVPDFPFGSDEEQITYRDQLAEYLCSSANLIGCGKSVNATIDYLD
jgi:hypothetical protein